MDGVGPSVIPSVATIRNVARNAFAGREAYEETLALVANRFAIARTVFVSHGGDVTCTSEPGVGSMVVISLPALTPDPSLCSPTSL